MPHTQGMPQPGQMPMVQHMMGTTMPPMQQQQRPQANLVNVQLPPVNKEEFEKCATPEQRRSYVGNAVYPMIIEAITDAQLVGRITGMIIDENVVQIDRLISDQQYFNQQVNEAYKLLLSQQNQATPQSQ